MVDQVGSLVLQLLLVVHRGGQRRLDAFLAHLLRNALRASCIEACGVGRGRIGGAAALKQHFELAQEVPLVLDGRKAALRAAVAGRALGVDEHEKRVAVAVGADVDEIEPVPARLALHPEALLGARPERDLLRFERLLERFRVHAAEHEPGPSRRPARRPGSARRSFPSQAS